jgi:serine/threonine-protein kinase SRK2
MFESDSFDSIFDYIKEIGTGSYGIVKLIRHKKTDQLLALKIIRNINMNEYDLHLQVSEHPNIIQVYHYYSPENMKIAGILMEYAPHGDLYKLVSEKKRIPESYARLIFMQMISAVDHCHQNNICHRDIKLENLLLHDHIVKLTDFGYACRIDDPDIIKKVGTMTYIAPEILLDTESDLIKSDIWACGVVLYILVCGQYPFEWGEDPDINTKESHKQITHNILNLKYILPDHLSEECKDLIKQIFVTNPKDRIFIDKIWNSKWLNMDVIFD